MKMENAFAEAMNGRIYGEDETPSASPADQSAQDRNMVVPAALTERFERIKRLALDAGAPGALPVVQSLRKIVRECLDGVAALAASPASTTLQDSLRVVHASAQQGVVAWVRRGADGILRDEFLPDRNIEPVRKQSGGWLPLVLAAAPPSQVPGSAEDARDAVRYRWLKAWNKCQGWSDDAIDRQIAIDAAMAATQQHNGTEV